jgi:AraC-like DNA-binding protein
MAALHSYCLFHGSLVSISDLRCRAPQSPCGAEEQARSHELVFTRRGLFVKHAGRRQVLAEPTQVLFFNRRESYRVSHPVSGGDECTVMSFSVETLTDALARYEPAARDRPDAPFCFTHAPLEPGVLLRSQQLRRRLRSGEACALEIEEGALGILHDVVGQAYRVRSVRPRKGRPRTAGARRELAEAVKLLLASQPAAKPSLVSLACAVRCSPYHLLRVFRSEVGTPIHQYLLRLRLAIALERVADGAPSLSALALDLGFSSHSHFTTLFRRTFGVSPATLRKNMTGSRLRHLRQTVER